MNINARPRWYVTENTLGCDGDAHDNNDALHILKAKMQLLKK